MNVRHLEPGAWTVSLTIFHQLYPAAGTGFIVSLPFSVSVSQPDTQIRRRTDGEDIIEMENYAWSKEQWNQWSDNGFYN